MLAALQRRARDLKRDVAAVWFCSRHPGTPLAAKALAVIIIAYAFSPIDLIPDFIPVLGLLDDIVLLPLGIWVVIRLIPQEVLSECRAQAAQWLAQGADGPRSYLAAAVIVTLWLAALWLAWRWLAPLLAR